MRLKSLQNSPSCIQHLRIVLNSKVTRCPCTSDITIQNATRSSFLSLSLQQYIRVPTPSINILPTYIPWFSFLLARDFHGKDIKEARLSVTPLLSQTALLHLYHTALSLLRDPDNRAIDLLLLCIICFLLCLHAYIPQTSQRWLARGLLNHDGVFSCNFLLPSPHQTNCVAFAQRCHYYYSLE